MKGQWLGPRKHRDLLLVFGGWALGAAAFAGMVGQTDVLLLDDYKDLTVDLPPLEGYAHIDLLAYSFGVAGAAHWLAGQKLVGRGLRLRRSVAIAGTLTPASVTSGIPPERVRATAEGLTAATFATFCRRAGLAGPAPQLDLEAARAELLEVMARGPAPAYAFDRIWIPRRDRIVPPQAQEYAWHSRAAAVRFVDAPHVPFRAGQDWQDWLQ
ncbi:pimeloyl-ACP methyl esterase BioG family protein [Thioclava sp. GXIMD4216]|uniref:pimeloyl-ACP methyl esterase BioG family protein n=1 Tax=Thioclava sp. GXIMD4216 TaxID=3131929 RepID=UPI0030CAA8DD